jgi:hypothetical protein
MRRSRPRPIGVRRNDLWSGADPASPGAYDAAMTDPWLLIPLGDYERHMSLPGVAQAQMLSAELAAAVRAHAPRSVAVAGCAGGNGFEALTAGQLQRIVGIDINPDYVAAARARFGSGLPGLELYVADITSALARVAPVDLVFAGLLLEYVDVTKALKTLRELCSPAGCIVVVLQLPSGDLPAVSPSPFASLRALSASMRLRDPADVAAAARAAGLARQSERILALPSGKRFAVLTFERSAAPA